MGIYARVNGYSCTEKLEKIKFLSIPTSLSMLQIIYKGRWE